MIMPPLSIAVCIATTGRPAILTEILRNVAAQTRAPEQVILCPAKPDDIDQAALATLPITPRVVHGSVGLYLTIAEVGRWNFGIPSVAFGLGRYPTYDRSDRQSSMKNQPTVFVSLASVHYRVGFVRSFGLNAYINMEQVYDVRHNLSGSQFGFSFSSQ